MTWRIGVTDDAIDADGTSVHGDLRLAELDAAGIEWQVISAHPDSDDDLAELDAVYALGHRTFDAEVLAHAPRLKHVARFGAGYDTIDLDACTAAGVVVTNTPEAIRTPLALAGLTLVLATTHNLVQKHRLTVTSSWGERDAWRGSATQGATLGVVGFGSVGAELARLAQGVGYTVIGTNRSGASEAADRLGVRLTSLDELLGASDVVVLTAALTSETRGMIGVAQLRRMGGDAVLVNIGRGQLVDQDALVQALTDGTIRAAGLDVFSQEPPEPDDRLLSLPNVTLAPHSLCWTDAFTAAVTTAANADIIAVSRGEAPRHALNPAALDPAALSPAALDPR